MAKKYLVGLQIQDDLTTFVASLLLIFDEISEKDRPLKDISMKFIGEHHRKVAFQPAFC